MGFRQDLERCADEVGLRAVARRAVDDFLRRSEQGRMRPLVAPVELPFQPVPVHHFHPRPELFLQLHGRNRMRLAGGCVELGAGDALLIPRGVAHQEEPAGRECFDLVVSYSEAGVGIHAAHGRRQHGRIRILQRIQLPCADSERLYAYLDDLVPQAEAGERGAPVVRALFQAHLAMLARLLAEERAEPHDCPPLVQRARHHMTRYLTDQRLSVAWLAELLHCSADHLSHVFRKSIGETISGSINAQRIGLGRQLLETTDMNVSQIALACGYRDPGYFTRQFRRAHGHSPRAWRRRLHAGR